jgi:hypothetical protein
MPKTMWQNYATPARPTYTIRILKSLSSQQLTPVLPLSLFITDTTLKASRQVKKQRQQKRNCEYHNRSHLV